MDEIVDLILAGSTDSSCTVALSYLILEKEAMHKVRKEFSEVTDLETFLD